MASVKVGPFLSEASLITPVVDTQQRSTARSSTSRHSGEVVQILGNQDDFFGDEWRKSLGATEPDDDGESTELEEESQEFSSQPVHIPGVPSSETKLKPKDYKSKDFAQIVLRLLKDELRIDGWASLPSDLPISALSIHKVSGSLTNAVFFISVPSPPPVKDATEWQPAPTVLLRVYGPSSGSLISRKHELHLLHTLSADYGIGPLVLGTFFNGRVEEYFDSRALHKEELRDPRISRWIARRMRELHSVDATQVILPDKESRKPDSSLQDGTERHQSSDRRPNLQAIRWANGSTTSLLSTSSQSSAFSWSDAYSSGPDSPSASFALLATSPSSTLPPSIQPSSGASESPAIHKKRSRSRLRTISTASQRNKLKVGAWENIKRWNREAEKVLAEIDVFAKQMQVDLDSRVGTPRVAERDMTLEDIRAFSALRSIDRLYEFKKLWDMPRFQKETKSYQRWVKEREMVTGKSKRVFAHNDTQYGNLLIRRADDTLLRERPHEQIIVIDFEYASTNPRGFDIANHFHEWQADYHHEEYPHSLTSHSSYPTSSERRRFFRAYVGADLGYDGHGDQDPRTPLMSPFSHPTLTEEGVNHFSLDDQRELEDERHHTPAAHPPSTGREDPRIAKLEDEVRTWSPCSHAMWAVWGIVQAHDDINAKIAIWKAEYRAERNVPQSHSGTIDSQNHAAPAPLLRRTKSGELRDQNDDIVLDDVPNAHEIEFDYLAYSLERVTLFRQQLKNLGVTLE